MTEEKFDQRKYMYEWSRKNMVMVSARFKKEFVEEFKKACKEQGLIQSQIIRNAMQEVIDHKYKNPQEKNEGK